MVVLILPNPCENTTAVDSLQLVADIFADRANRVTVLTPAIKPSRRLHALLRRKRFAALAIDTLKTPSFFARGSLLKQLNVQPQSTLILSFGSACLDFANWLAKQTQNRLLATLDGAIPPPSTWAKLTPSATVIASSPDCLRRSQLALNAIASDHVSLKHIQIGVNLQRYHRDRIHSNRMEAVIAKLNLQADEMVLTVPAMPPTKDGCDLFFKALALLRQQSTATRCVFVTSGRIERQRRQNLLAQAQRFGLDGMVTVLEDWDDIATIIALSTLVVRPWFEAGLVPSFFLQAQAFGRQVLCFNESLPPQPPDCAFVVGQTGRIASSSNPLALAENIRQLCHHAFENREAIATTCLEHLQTHFNYDRCLQAYRDLLENHGLQFSQPSAKLMTYEPPDSAVPLTAKA